MVFVIWKYTNVFEEGGISTGGTFHRDNFPWEGKFPGAKFPWETYTERICQNSDTKFFFCPAFSLPAQFYMWICSWGTVWGNFSERFGFSGRFVRVKSGS